MSTLVMLERADELRSMELVGRGGGELQRRGGTGLEQEREQERRGNRSMSSLWLQSASQWARGRPGDGESGRRSSMPVGEDGGDGVTAGLLVLLGVVGRKSRSRQSFGRRRGGEAVVVAAANGVGGDGAPLGGREREPEKGGGEGTGRVRGLGGCVASRTGSRATRGSRRWPGGSRRWPRPLGRAPRLASAYWQRKTTGGSGDGLGRAGPGKWAPGNFLLSLSFISFLFLLFCF